MPRSSEELKQRADELHALNSPHEAEIPRPFLGYGRLAQGCKPNPSAPHNEFVGYQPPEDRFPPRGVSEDTVTYTMCLELDKAQVSLFRCRAKAPKRSGSFPQRPAGSECFARHKSAIRRFGSRHPLAPKTNWMGRVSSSIRSRMRTWHRKSGRYQGFFERRTRRRSLEISLPS